MSSQSRHVYTRQERILLEASFTRQSHPNIDEKERLAKLLNCNIIQISNWFQNHRVRTQFNSHQYSLSLFLFQRRMKKQQKTIVNSNPVASSPPPYPMTYYCQQANCSCNYNSHSPSYYYYSSPYIYAQEPIYTQPMFVHTQVDYEE